MVDGSPGLHIVEQRLDVRPERRRRSESDDRRREYHSSRLTEHQPDDIAPRRAERHAHADFSRAAPHDVAHHAECADRREHQRQPGEQRRDEHRESLRRDRRAHVGLDRTQAGNRLIRIGREHGLPDDLTDGGQRKEVFTRYAARRKRVEGLAERRVRRRPRRLSELLVRVGGKPDDGAPVMLVVGEAVRDPLADRILSRIVLPRERFVDDDDVRRSKIVVAS